MNQKNLVVGRAYMYDCYRGGRHVRRFGFLDSINAITGEVRIRPAEGGDLESMWPDSLHELPYTTVGELMHILKGRNPMDIIEFRSEKGAVKIYAGKLSQHLKKCNPMCGVGLKLIAKISNLTGNVAK